MGVWPLHTLSGASRAPVWNLHVPVQMPAVVGADSEELGAASRRKATAYARALRNSTAAERREPEMIAQVTSRLDHCGILYCAALSIYDDNENDLALLGF